MFLASTLTYALLSYPLFLLMSHGTLSSAMLGGVIFATCNSFYSGCMAATMVELFPTQTRYSGVAIAYNLGQTLFGGTAPLIATALIGVTSLNLAPAFYVCFSAVVGIVACIFISSRYGQPLDEMS